MHPLMLILPSHGDVSRAPKDLNRGTDARYWTPPAQIPASPIRALGSYLGCLTVKRTFGHG